MAWRTMQMRARLWLNGQYMGFSPRVLCGFFAFFAILMYSENALSRLIIGEAICVHKNLGPGLLESVYETCLSHRLMKAGLNILKQQQIPVVFEEIKMECGYRADIIVEKKVIIEVKAIEAIHEIHKAQTLTYLKLTGLRLGLLMNFNVLYIKEGIKRIVNNL